MTQSTSDIFSIADAPRVKVMRYVKEWIDRGTIGAGEPLPSERAISEHLNVNRKTVRRALEMLREEGILKQQGRRTRVTAPTTPASEGWMERSIAVLAPITHELSHVHRNKGWTEFIAQGALEAIGVNGYDAIVLHPDRLAGERIRQLVAGRPRGVVVTSDLPLDDDFVRRLEATGVRVVAHGDQPQYVSYDRVFSDHEQGGYELTKWLIGQGRRRIVQYCMAPSDLWWARGRRAGYERAMAEADLAVLEPIQSTPWGGSTQTREGFAASARFIGSHLIEHLTGSSPIDALMLNSDGYVPQAAAACRLFGRIPNQDVALVGYDNYWSESPELRFEPTTPMATVDKCNFLAGQELVRLLNDRVDGRLGPGPVARKLKPELVIVGRS